jgi:hypothetical protein
LTIQEAGKEEQTPITLPASDIPKVVEIIGGHLFAPGDTRTGKSQLISDIHRNHFGGSADDGGKSNWIPTGNSFTSEGYFMTLDQSKIGEGKGMLNESRVPVKARIGALCNMLDEVNLTIPEVQPEYFGIGENRHKDIPLGKDGYCLCMATCNLNKVNGDFAGASQLNRALLNRFGIGLDIDYYHATDEDKNEVNRRMATGTLKLAPIRDISEKILGAYEEINKRAGESEPYLDAYLRFFSSGLAFCSKDKDSRKKKVWPMKCGECDFQKDNLESRVCHLAKHSNQGTLEGIKRFAVGMKYLVELKHGEDVQVNPFELALESFKFTTYHGNLNQIETMSTYGGEDQEHMEEVVSRLRKSIEPYTNYINSCIESALKGNAEIRFIQMGDTYEIYSEEIEEKLKALSKGSPKKSKITYTIAEPFKNLNGKSFEDATGLSIGWFKGYLEFISKVNKGK